MPEFRVVEYAGSEMIVASPKSVIHARPCWLMRMLAFTQQISQETEIGRASCRERVFLSV